MAMTKSRHYQVITMAGDWEGHTVKDARKALTRLLRSAKRRSLDETGRITERVVVDGIPCYRLVKEVR